jgi:hypothetical protein
MIRGHAGLDPDPQNNPFPNNEAGTHAFRDKFPACLLHVGRQDDQELHQEFILAAKGQSPFILDYVIFNALLVQRWKSQR